MSRILFFLFVFTVLNACDVFAQTADESDVMDILKIVKKQQKSWNKGDLEGFMEGYWQSDSLKFITKSGVTYGWQATLDRYKKGYPDKETMGKLEFDIISIEAIGAENLFLVGKWQLTRKTQENLQGYFTLIWKKIANKWVIIADHSS